MQEKVVVHFRDGRLLKGYATSPAPNAPFFEMTPLDAVDKPVAVQVDSLKAVFFVKDFVGDADYSEHKAFGPDAPESPGRVSFHMEDGEVLVGIVDDYQPDRAGFLLVPVDPKSNNTRCFVVAKAIRRASLV